MQEKLAAQSMGACENRAKQHESSDDHWKSMKMFVKKINVEWCKKDKKDWPEKKF